tara:strand:- start:133 stop:639 length:507 start_codon:yes stop_codon:yes gene_type:complete
MDNALFNNAIALQSDLDKRTAKAGKAKQELNDAAYVQMVLFIAGNQSEKINAGTKKAGALQAQLIEAHGFKKRHAQTITSVSLNKNIFKMVAGGLAKLETPENNGQLAQSVTNILADNELTSVNKLKAYIATPVDKVAKLLEAIAKLEGDEMEEFKAGYEIMTGRLMG